MPIAPGDLVLCSAHGRVFHAEVRGTVVGGLRVAPLERGLAARTVKTSEVVEHWARQPVPNAAPDRAQASFDHLLDP